MSSTTWYMKDVFRWRTGASVAWSLLLLPPAVGIFIFLAHFALLHPSQWIIGWLQTCFSLHGVGCVTLILLCTAMVSVMNAFSYIVTPHIHRNRLSIILSVTRPIRLLHALGHALLGGVIAWACSKLIGGRYAALSFPCGEESLGLCLNEYHLFLVLFGTFLGALYSISYFLHRSNLLSFNIIQQVKFFQVKTYLAQSVVLRALWTLRLCLYFCAFYYLFGCLFKSWLLSNLHLGELPTPVDSLRGLLDPPLLWQAWLLGSLLTHLWALALYLFQIFNTEMFEFEIETAFNTSQERTLHRALGEQRSPLVQYLAYQDLSILAEHSVSRRKQIFTLSQPGGHPHNWNKLCTECLVLIASLTDRLVAHQERATNGISREKRQAEADARKKKHNGGKEQRGSSNSSYYTADASPAPHQRIATLSAATAVGTPMSPPLAHTPRPQNISYSALTPRRDNVWVDTPGSHGHAMPWTGRPISELGSGAGSAHQHPRGPAQPRQPLGFVVFLQPRLAAVRRLPLFRYWVDPFPEAPSRALFTDVQLHIWALESLSSLVAASFHEDSFGVVQKSLPDILTEMLALHNALEKLLKLPTLLTTRDPRELKVTRIGPAHPDDQLRNDLRTTVKTSLHRVIATFSKHLRCVPLAPEYKKQLTDLMEYKI